MKFIALILLTIVGSEARANSVNSSLGSVEIMPIVERLKGPWGFGFLPDGGLLITEKRGRLLHVSASGSRQQVAGVPGVRDKGQGGLLDVVVSRNFATSREVFLSYVTKQKGGSGTAVLAAQLSNDGSKLLNERKIFEMAAGSSGGRHFGSRIVEALDGSLFVTIGERGDRPSAQDLGRHEGSIIRISRDGGAHASNPFKTTEGARPEIWSYGHRNPQGMALDLSGNLWAVEHGAKGGDEINRIKRGANYGWPVISYGTHYSGGKIGEGTSKFGMEQPLFYWDPSIAPSGMMIYSGKLWPQWKGHFFVGSLKFDYISRLSGSRLTEREQLASSETKRVRDVREAPDGAIWFLSEDKGTLYRMTPSN